MEDRWRRLPSARVIRAKGSLTLVHGDGSASRLEGDSAALCEAVLAFFDRTRSRDDVVAHVRALAGAPFDERVVDDLLALLRRAGVLGSAARAGGATSGQAPSRPRRLRVVLGVTGAIQAVEAPRMVSLLQQRGFETRVAATKASLRFVSAAALTALAHREVATGLWGGPDSPAAHIELSDWADVVVVYPASATTLSRIARGDFGDIVSAVALATRAPVLLVPSMNEGMLRAPAVARNLAVLRDDGFLVAEPSWGIEVADPPPLRAPRRGAAPAPERVLDLVGIAAAQGGRAAARGGLGTDWDRVYEGDPASLPWAVEQVPDDLAEELARLPPPRSLLDLGTGLGTVARYAAGLGYRVVATDVSRTAIARAEERAGDLPITFVRDDLTDTRLAGRFDVAVDRGMLHTLEEADINTYSSTVTRLVRPGGALLLVTDGPGARANRRTLRLSPPDLAARLPDFTLQKAASTTLCPDDPGAAWLTVWTRRQGA